MEADFTEDGPKTLKQFLDQQRPVFPVGTCDMNKSFDFLQSSPLKLAYVPKVVVIDKNGMIRTQFYGDHPFFRDAERQLRGQMDALLKEPGPKPAAPAPKAVPKKK